MLESKHGKEMNGELCVENCVKSKNGTNYTRKTNCESYGNNKWLISHSRPKYTSKVATVYAK